MSESIYKIELDERSESHYFLPVPEYSDALYYLTSMAHEYTKPQYYIERFDTDVYMVNYTLSGKARFIYDGVSYTLEPGMLVFAYLGVHNVLFPLTDDYEYCCFHLNGAHTKNIYRRTTCSGKSIVFKYSSDGVLERFEKFRSWLIEPINFFEISKELNIMLTDILSFSVGEAKNISSMAHEIYKLVFNNNTSVSEIAKVMNFSSVYLERKFKKETGISIRDLIINRKLEQAENLLLTTSLSVNDIAKRLGYADTVGLVHLFRSHLDCTPLEFRKRKNK